MFPCLLSGAVNEEREEAGEEDEEDDGEGPGDYAGLLLLVHAAQSPVRGLQRGQGFLQDHIQELDGRQPSEWRQCHEGTLYRLLVLCCVQTLHVIFHKLDLLVRV